MEKIGSGNWYWSFSSDEKHEREGRIAHLSKEVEKARKSCSDATAGLAAEAERREEADDEGQRDSLIARKAEVQAAVDWVRNAEAQLTGRLNPLSNRDSKQIQDELAGFQQEALQWTDNIYILEEYLRKLAGGDRQMVDLILRECYGDEYVDGGRLNEL